ncbi:hypothetical protein G6726_06165 [Polynucleobacter paneuropaeus]|jgi:septal ring factor EnvC (AmiA/AmiB activator)|nr:hypothetical protein G6726_06165 [Polynucleobacter paneuropaeus]
MKYLRVVICLMLLISLAACQRDVTLTQEYQELARKYDFKTQQFQEAQKQLEYAKFLLDEKNNVERRMIFLGNDTWYQVYLCNLLHLTSLKFTPCFASKREVEAVNKIAEMGGFQKDSFAFIRVFTVLSATIMFTLLPLGWVIAMFKKFYDKGISESFVSVRYRIDDGYRKKLNDEYAQEVKNQELKINSAVEISKDLEKIVQEKLGVVEDLDDQIDDKNRMCNQIEAAISHLNSRYQKLIREKAYVLLDLAKGEKVALEEIKRKLEDR